jgi:hypothetical protein
LSGSDACRYLVCSDDFRRRNYLSPPAYSVTAELKPKPSKIQTLYLTANIWHHFH